MATKKKVPKKAKDKIEKQIEVDISALEDLSAKYEDILEAKITALYFRIINFISASQLPLVHVNAVLDLIKRAAIDQLKTGYKIDKE